MSNIEDELSTLVTALDRMANAALDRMANAALDRMANAALARARPLMVEPHMHLNRDKTVAVANDYFWNDNMAECPRGVKVQLLGKSGVAVYGRWNGVDTFWTDWAPLPKRRPKNGTSSS